MGLLKKDFILQDVSKLKGVGPQLSKYLKKNEIFNYHDLYVSFKKLFVSFEYIKSQLLII